MKTDLFEQRLIDFSSFIQVMKNLALVNKYLKGNEFEWLIDASGPGPLFAIEQMSQNIRCDMKIVDIYAQRVIYERYHSLPAPSKHVSFSYTF